MNIVYVVKENMDKFIIEGGRTLKGEVEISGSKNACLPIMAATLLAKGETILHNVPLLRDVNTMIRLLKIIGAEVKIEDHTLIIDTSLLENYVIPYELVSTMRASILVMAPVLTRFGIVKISRPGGCAIGIRPIDDHLKGLESLGSSIIEDHGYIEMMVPKLKGAQICLNEKSVTATENIIMAAVLAEGQTKIINGAGEPHVEDLKNFLRAMGANIKEDNDITIIEGVKKLNPTEYTISSDYIEADTFMIAGAITKGDIFLRWANWKDSETEINKLKEIGVEVNEDTEGIRVRGNKRLKSCDIKTSPYPGFPTDLQPQITSLLTVADGTSIVTETMYENRFTHVPELQRMGANIRVEDRSIIINGVKELQGAEVMASDIRAGASLVLAALKASGKTEISRVYHIDRGYERIEEKLKKLGGIVERVDDAKKD